jgi:hypothetical protein
MASIPLPSLLTARALSPAHDESVWVWDASTEAEPAVPNFHTHSVNSITSPADSTCITIDEESAQLSIVGHAYPAWTNTQTGWIHSVLGGYRLMWVPEQLIHTASSSFPAKGLPCINFQDSKIGRDWAGCYIAKHCW